MPVAPAAVDATRSGPFGMASIRRHWLWALGFASASAVLAFLISFAITPIYVGQVVLLPVKTEAGAGGLFQIPSAFGELASMAGVSTGASDTIEALETLQSRALAQQFINDRGLVDALVEPSFFGTLSGRSKKMSSTKKDNLAIARLRESVVNVVEDKRTGVVHLSVFWQDPRLAADWANGLVSLVNQKLRSKALEESKRRLDYLNAEAERTSVVGVKDAVYRVIEAEIKAMMLANARGEYAFRVIDSAAPAEIDDPVRPRRSAFLVAGFFLGGIAAILFRHRRERAA